MLTFVGFVSCVCCFRSYLVFKRLLLFLTFLTNFAMIIPSLVIIFLHTFIIRLLFYVYLFSLGIVTDVLSFFLFSLVLVTCGSLFFFFAFLFTVFTQFITLVLIHFT